jgi:hypothetical protein
LVGLSYFRHPFLQVPAQVMASTSFVISLFEY